MANITPYVNAIMNAVYGEQVRSSIGDAITAINTESEASKATANNAKTTADAAAAVVGGYSGIEHRNHYRGRNLGTSVTEEQWTAISSGNFTDLFVGDFWVINDVYWQIADFDYWYKSGTTSLELHHAVIVPSGNLLSAVMNSTNTTEGGYNASRMNTVTMPQVLSTINSAFGSSHIIAHEDLYSSAIVDGKITANEKITDSKVALMDEIMYFGTKIKNMGDENKCNKNQLAVMRLRPYYPARVGFWLRDVCGPQHFVFVGGDGIVQRSLASDSRGVRPVFAIGVNS